MSRIGVFVFVEGRVDRFFYSRLCETALAGFGLLYEIAMAQELPGGTGGKPGLLGFYSYLEFKAAFLDDFKGKKLGTIFFFDKDLDDYTRSMKPEPHAVYTQFYEVENHLFHHGDLVTAAAGAAELDLPSVRAQFGNPVDWRRQCADAWRTWTKMCAFSHVRRARCICTYSMASQINLPTYGPVDPGLVVRHMAILERASGMPPQKFLRAFNRVARWVDAKYTTGSPDSAFKGKWYRGFVALAVDAASNGRAYNGNGLEDRVVANLAISLDPTEPWAFRFANPLQTVAAAIVPPAQPPPIVGPVASVPRTNLLSRLVQSASTFVSDLVKGGHRK